MSCAQVNTAQGNWSRRLAGFLVGFAVCCPSARAEDAPPPQLPTKLIGEANNLRRQLKLTIAIAKGKETLQIIRASYGDGSREAVENQYWLDQMELLQRAFARTAACRRRKEFDEAVRAARVAGYIETRHYREDDPQATAAKKWVATIEREREVECKTWHRLEPGVAKSIRDQEITAAITTLRQMLKLQIEKLGKDHLLVANTHQRITVLHEQAGEFSMADEAQHEAHHAFMVSRGEAGWRTVEAKLRLDQLQRMSKLPKKVQARLVEVNSRLNSVNKRDVFETKRVSISQLVADRKLIEETLGEDCLLFAICTRVLGTNYLNSGETGKALPLLVRAETSFKQLAGAQHPLHAHALTWLSQCHQELKDYSKAEESAKRTVEIYRNVQEGFHENNALAFNRLFLCQMDLGKFAEAENQLLKALVIHAGLHGESNRIRGNLLSNLGELYVETKRPIQGRRRMQQAVQILKKTTSEESAGYRSALNNLAMFDILHGHVEAANASLLKIATIEERILGENHPRLAKTLGTLAMTYQSLGDRTRAEAALRRSLKI